jgi:hypothetical protein
MVFYHPKKYKELHGLTSRKCNTRQRSQGGLPVNGASNSNQAISDEAATAATSVRPGSGHKQQATSKQEGASNQQSTSSKAQATSLKP